MNMPRQFQVGLANSRASSVGPPQFVPGLTSSQEAVKNREEIATRKKYHVPDLSNLAIPNWIKRLVDYGIEVVSQKIAHYVIENARSTEIFVRESALFQPSVDGSIFDNIAGIQAGAPVVLTGVGGPWTTVASYQIPTSNQGALHWIGHDLSNVAAWPNIQWRILKNGDPVGSYDGWYGQIGTILAPFRQYLTVIEQSAIVALQARNTGFGGAINATGRIGGWYWLSNKISDRKWETALKD
ncbi:MAG: hypothetical protein KKD44_29480 [Proteobacteria bacterium]|nr:hypothetical protein [Pseudomonadota bacterium]